MPEIVRLEPCLGSGHAAFARAALKDDTNCLVLFDASWRRLGKRVETQSADVADRYAVTLLSVDVDNCPELARRAPAADFRDFERGRSRMSQPIRFSSSDP